MDKNGFLLISPTLEHVLSPSSCEYAHTVPLLCLVGPRSALPCPALTVSHLWRLLQHPACCSCLWNLHVFDVCIGVRGPTESDAISLICQSSSFSAFTLIYFLFYFCTLLHSISSTACMSHNSGGYYGVSLKPLFEPFIVYCPGHKSWLRGGLLQR